MREFVISILDIVDSIKNIDTLFSRVLIGMLLLLFIASFVSSTSIRKSTNQVTKSLFSFLNKVFIENKRWLMGFITLVLLTAYFTYYLSGSPIDFILLPYLLVYKFSKTFYNSLSENSEEIETETLDLIKSNIVAIFIYILTLHQIPTSLREFLSQETEFIFAWEALISSDMYIIASLIGLSIIIAVLEKKLLESKFIFAKCEHNYIRISLKLNCEATSIKMSLHEMCLRNSNDISPIRVSEIMYQIVCVERSIDLLEEKIPAGIRIFEKLNSSLESQDKAMKLLSDFVFNFDSSSKFDELSKVLLNSKDYSIIQFSDNYDYILEKIMLLPKDEKCDVIFSLIELMNYDKSIEESLLELSLLEEISIEEKKKRANELIELILKAKDKFEKRGKNNDEGFEKYINEINDFLEEMKDDFLELKKLGILAEDLCGTSISYFYLVKNDSNEASKSMTVKTIKEIFEKIDIEIEKLEVEMLKNLP